MNEIEAKIRVDDFTGILNCSPEYTARIIDTYYDKPSYELYHTNKFIRVRQRIMVWVEPFAELALTDKWMITYKGQNVGAAINNREEIEVEVGNGAGPLLNALGYTPIGIVDKTRALYKLHGCEVCLDDVVELGKFVEIEGPSEEVVKKCIELLKLDKHELVNLGYAQMLIKPEVAYFTHGADWHA